MTRRLIWTAVALMPFGCRLPEADFAKLFGWMNCTECTSGERLAAASVGAKAVPTLARWLAEGPPPDRQLVMRRKLASEFRYSGGVATSAAETTYVDRQLGSYIDRYYERSAISLSDIGNADALDALDEAIANAVARGYRPGVIRAIRFARGRLTASPFIGTVTPAAAGFGDSITVTPVGPMTLIGTELANPDGQAFPATELVLRRGAINMSFAAIGEPGLTWVELSGFPGGQVRHTAITISTIADISDRATRRCADGDFACLIASMTVVSALPLDHVVFLSLADSASTVDTLDYFKIQPAANMPVTASLRWMDGADLDLEWRSCFAPLTVIPPNTGATSNNPETTSTPIAGGDCRILAIKMKDGVGNRHTFARLTLKSP